jgi:probable F420-dependent oxidoreductase
VGVWASPLRYADPAAIADAAAELESLGYTALWIPDTGGDVFGAVASLLRATENIVVATGILNLWMHSPEDSATAFAELTAEYGDRFLLGIGVSHAPLIDKDDPGRYRRPLASMTAFLDGLDAAQPTVPVASRVLAALGPKMLDLAAHRSGGVHPYLVTPEHTAQAREAVGPDALVLPEQTVILCTDAEQAHEIGDRWVRGYLTLPNYRNSLLRLGFTEEDVTTVSDRLFDALIAWGDEAAIKARVDEHLAAGADHVCIQVLTDDLQALPVEQWRRLGAVFN